MNQHRNTKTIQQYKDTKQRLQKETRRAYWNYLENIICYDENSEKVQKQKEFWNYIRNTKKDSSGVAPLRQEGMLIDDTRQKPEILTNNIILYLHLNVKMKNCHLSQTIIHLCLKSQLQPTALKNY